MALSVFVRIPKATQVCDDVKVRCKMPKNIKQKEKPNHSIRKLDRNIQYSSRIKRTMIDQYKKNKEDNKKDKENSNATNYATTKLMRAGDRGVRKTAYAITGVSKKVHNKAKMKLIEQRLKKKEENKKNQDDNNTNLVKTTDNSKTNSRTGKSADEVASQNNYQTNSQRYIKNNNSKIKGTSNEFSINDNNTKAIKYYQKKMLIKDRQNYRNIKEHSYKDNGIKQNINSLKIKTRENSAIKNKYDNTKTQLNHLKSNDLMKKSALQKTKEKTSKIKENTKKMKKAIVNAGKKLKSSAKGIGLFIAFGGGFVLFLILIVIMIAGLLKSVFGIFFTDDTAKANIDSITVGTAVQQLEYEVDDEIDNIKNSVSYDKVVVDKGNIYWKDIISIYAVLASNRYGIDVSTMNDEAYQKLKEIFYEVVDIDYETSTYYVIYVHTVNGEQVRERQARTRLDIKVNCMTFDEMVGIYGFSVSERNQALLLLSQEYDDMWEAIFADI